jgi:hypothetical protein
MRGGTAGERSLQSSPPQVDNEARQSFDSLAAAPADSPSVRGVLDPPVDPESPAPSSSGHALDKAKEELINHVDFGLNGVLHVNEVLDQMLAFASLELSAHPDLEYEDNDAIAYKLKGGPGDAEARVLVGLQPFEDNGRRCRYLQMQLDIGSKPEYWRDTMRDAPNVNLSISYDEADSTVPTRFGLMLQRRVDLYASKQAGIDAYQGKYTSGAYYWIDLKDNPPRLWSGTIGIVNGRPVEPKSFDDISPLSGDLELDRERLSKLLARLQQHQSAIKGN